MSLYPSAADSLLNHLPQFNIPGQGSLVLSRRLGETIIIGDNIAITVCSLLRYQTKLRICAPKTLSIYRLEIYDRMHKKHGSNIPLILDDENLTHEYKNYISS